MAYRRRVLAAVGGFDERFPRAYREDADLGLRVTAAGWTIAEGARYVRHPVSPAPWWVSVAKQAGNADDVLMDRLHGPEWRQRAEAPAGRRRWHLATTAALALSVTAAVFHRRRLAGATALAWAGLTADFARRRLRPGPRDFREVTGVAATSMAIPPVATARWVAGRRRARRLVPAGFGPASPAIDAVLFDRDGTLVEDGPYNGDPDRVRLVGGAAEALDRLRHAGVPVGIVSNQSGVARGLIDTAQVEAVNARVAELLGPFDHVSWCPHGPDEGCTCRKPEPGQVRAAAAALGVAPGRLAVVGDIGSDVDAAAAAGATGLLVPTEVTLTEELERCPTVFAHLGAAVDHLLGSKR